MPAEPAQEPQSGPQEPEQVTTPPEPQGGPQKPPQGREDDELSATRREAADRRRQLRETEAERDALRARVDRQDRAEVERIAASRMANAEDLFLVVGGLDDLRGDDGELDREKVEETIAKALEDRPHWAAPRVGFDGGVRGGVQPARSFGEAMKDAAAGR